MIITDKNRIDDLVKDLFGNISYRHELSEDDYRVVSRYSKEIKAAFFQLSWFTEEELLALREEVATLMTDDLQDMLLLVKFPPKSIMLDYEEEVLALLEKTLEIWHCFNLVHMVWNNVVEQTGDALGYGVEFMSRRSILSRFGENGITKFALDCNGKALISDDTQMTLFTANGMLMGLTRTNDIRVVTLEAVFWHYLIKLAISMFLGFFITPVYLVYCLYKIVRLIIKR